MSALNTAGLRSPTRTMIRCRLQIRVEGYGEGSLEPAEAAARVIEDTKLQTFMTVHQGRLMVRVWHSTLGFTSPGGQPAWVGVRLLVPARGPYRVTTEAFHGAVVIQAANAWLG